MKPDIRAAAVITSLIAAGLFCMTGCEREGPFERAGEEIDEAVEDAGDAIEDATDLDGKRGP